MSRIAILSTDALYPLVQSSFHPWMIEDDRPLIEALQVRHEVFFLSWRALAETLNTEQTPPPLWSGARPDMVLIRTPWGYMQDISGFLRALARLEASNVLLLNSARIVQWNLDKRYLLELAQAGLPVIPTRYVTREGLETLPHMLTQESWAEVVIKPAVGAGGEWTYRVEHTQLQSLLETLKGAPVDAWLVQPFRPAILDEGEWSLIFFGGTFSHAVLKQSGGDFRIHEEHGGKTRWDQGVPDAYIQASQRVLAQVTEAPLYARVDGVATHGVFEVMELELIEPELFFRADPAAATRLAQAIDARLRVL